MLRASLTAAVAEMGPVSFGFRLGDGLGDGVRCTLYFRASLAPAVAKVGPVGFCESCQIVRVQFGNMRKTYLARARAGG